MPAWVTNILDVQDGTASVRRPDSGVSDWHPRIIEEKKLLKTPKVGDVVVDMKDVNVTYGTRKVTNYRSFKKNFFLIVPSDLTRFSRILPGK